MVWVDDFGHAEYGTLVGFVEGLMDRVQKDAGGVNALITVADDALDQAASIEDRLSQGEVLPLAGMPLVVKDNVDVGGMRCTRGSKWFRDRVAPRDATVVAGLRKAGAVIIGKASLHEFAYGGTNNNPWYGAVRNPWDLERIPGGSSGGSGAALAAGWCVGAIGTDTGGSVRCPASFAGVVGLRPTMGVVSNTGAFHIAASFDTVGAMARRASDVRRLYEAMLGFDTEDPYSIQSQGGKWNAEAMGGSLRGLRFAFPKAYFLEGVDREIVDAMYSFVDILRELGATVLEEVTVDSAARAREIASEVIKAEALAQHVERLNDDPSMFGEDVATRLKLGLELQGWEVAGLMQECVRLRRELQLELYKVDAVITPTVPSIPGKIENSEMISTTAEATRFTYPWSVAYGPSVSVPCGLTAGGLPIGAQLVGRPFSDLLLLAIAEEYQRRTNWHLQVAPLR